MESILKELAIVKTEIFLVGGLLFTLVIGLFNNTKWLLYPLAIVVVLFSCLLSAKNVFFENQINSTFSPMLVQDNIGQMLIFLLDIFATVLVGLSIYFDKANQKKVEWFTFFIASLLASHFIILSANWFLLYISIELLSLTGYVLVAFNKNEQKSADAGLKYLIYGAIASGIMLYGISLLYGLTGSLSLQQNYTGVLDKQSGAALFALVLMFSGIAFKTTVAPFHFWAPDVYLGAPYTVTVWLSIISKIAGLAILIRVLYAFPVNGLVSWLWFCGTAAGLAIVLGNIGAFSQVTFRKMMAFSGIAHAGYFMATLLPYSKDAIAATLFYIFIYGMMTLLAFVAGFELKKEFGTENMQHWHKQANKMVSISFAIAMFSLIGIPPTAGFVAKLFAILPLWGAYQHIPDFIWLMLLVLMVLGAVFSFFYYTKPLINLFIKTPEITQPTQTPPLEKGVTTLRIINLLIALLTLSLIILGIFGFDKIIAFIVSKI